MIFTLCWQIAVWVFRTDAALLTGAVRLPVSLTTAWRGRRRSSVPLLRGLGRWGAGLALAGVGLEVNTQTRSFFTASLPWKKWWVGRASFSKLREGSSMQISYHINSYYLYIIMSSTPSYHGRTHDSTSTLKKDMSCQTLSNHIVSGAIECSHFIGCCSTYNGCFQIMAIDVIL